jgi:serine/threonine protein kinase
MSALADRRWGQTMQPLGPGDPRQVGPYRIRARLGAGGMGQVFLGYSRGGRAVAVKVIHRELARDPAFRTRFRREVAAASAVSGAYTAPVTAAGPDDDPPWLATVFVPGPSLAAAVAEAGPLPAAAVWKLAAGLVEALQAVHSCGLVHRDLKPGNVLLAIDGPRLIDFGIARALERTAVTSTGQIVGTPSFMSPEQVEGGRAGPASDVFSLGCVIVFAATGTGAFGDGPPASMLYRVVHAAPTLAELPGGLRELAAACLAKKPEDRLALAGLVEVIAAGQASGPGTGPASFWPVPVTGLIRSYQARLTADMPDTPATADAPYQPTVLVRGDDPPEPPDRRSAPSGGQPPRQRGDDPPEPPDRRSAPSGGQPPRLRGDEPAQPPRQRGDAPTVLPRHTQGDETPTDDSPADEPATPPSMASAAGQPPRAAPSGLDQLRAEPAARIAAAAGAVSAARGAWQDAMTARDRAAVRIAATLPPVPDLPGLGDRVAALDGLRQAERWTQLAAELDAIEQQAAAASERSRDTERTAVALVDRRDELRGLLDAYRARAARLGAIEDTDLEARYATARELLYSRPCDLAASADAVTGYQQAVLALSRRRRRS